MGRPLSITGVRGYEGLALAIVYRAALDLNSSSPGLRADAAEFFDSSWYTDLLTYLDLPPNVRPIMED